MKKVFKLLLITLLLFMPFMVKAEDADKVKVTNVVVKEKSDDVVVGDSVINGVNVKFDIKFKNVNDYVKYEITIKNDDTEDYELANGSDTSASEYVTYTFDAGNNTIIEAGTEVKLYVTAKYTKEVPEDKIDALSGMYAEPNESGLDLVNGAIKVPNTLKIMGYASILVILGLIIAGLILINKNHKKGVALVLVAVLLIPFTVSALKQLKLKINADIKVSPRASTFCIKQMKGPSATTNQNQPTMGAFDRIGAHDTTPNYKGPKFVEEELNGMYYYYFEFNDGETMAEFMERNNQHEVAANNTISCFGSKDDYCIRDSGNFATPEAYIYWAEQNYDAEMAECLRAITNEVGTPEYSDAETACVGEYKSRLMQAPIKDSSYGCYTGDVTITPPDSSESSSSESQSETSYTYMACVKSCPSNCTSVVTGGCEYYAGATGDYTCRCPLDSSSSSSNGNSSSGSSNETNSTNLVCVKSCPTGCTAHIDGGCSSYPGASGNLSCVCSSGDSSTGDSGNSSSGGSTGGSTGGSGNNSSTDEYEVTMMCVSSCPSNCIARTDGGCAYQVGATGNFDCMCPKN